MMKASILAKVLKPLPAAKWGTQTTLEAREGRGRVAHSTPWGYYLVELPWDGEEVPRVGVPPVLADLLKAVGGEVSLRLDGKALVVEGEKGSYSLSVFDEEALSPEPEPPEVEGVLELKGARKALEAALEVARRAEVDPTNPERNPRAVRVRVEGGEAEVSATDGYKLKVFTLPGSGQGEAVLPAEETEDFLRLAEEGDTLRLGHGKKGELVLEALGEGRRVLAVIPRPKGLPPDWRRLALGEREGFLVATAKSLREALERALAVQEGKRGVHPVRLSATPLGIRIAARGEGAETEEVIPGEGEGEALVDGRHLLSVLEGVEGAPDLSVHSLQGGGTKVLLVRHEGMGYLGMVALLRE